jgi:hypothetical protein
MSVRKTNHQSGLAWTKNGVISFQNYFSMALKSGTTESLILVLIWSDLVNPREFEGWFFGPVLPLAG